MDPFESEWVRRMFDWYCEGVSTKEIQTRLSRDGVLTRRSNAQWSLGSIQLILRNPVYAGYFDYTDKLVGETVRIQTPPLISPSLFQIAQDRRKQNRERSTPTRPTRHFYLLRGVIVCGHCGTAMGGRTHKAGHQHVYYCTQKEKAWKTRGDDHPKWKRGSGCSMVRSVNIALTDQLVWKMVKETVQKLRDRLPDAGDPQGPDHQDVGGEEGIQTDGITWMSPDQMDLVSDEDRRALITRVLTRVSVFFERETNRHLLKMQLSEPISCLLAGNRELVPLDATAAVPEGGSFQGIGTCSGAGEVGPTPKKSRGSQGHLAAEHAYSVTVE